MLGEETGRLCRHEVSGLPARSNRGLSIRQVDGANAMGVHRHGQMNRKTGFDSSLPVSLRSTRRKPSLRIFISRRFSYIRVSTANCIAITSWKWLRKMGEHEQWRGNCGNCSHPDSCRQAYIGKQAGPMGSKDL